jgi:hypothetical protein
MPVPGEFPTRENCDSTNPEEAFLWMFAAPPGVKGAPLLMPISFYRKMSRRLWDLGCRQSEEPTLEWVAPSANEPNWLTSAGRWVPAGSAPKRTEEEMAAAEIAKMSGQQRKELRDVLESGDFFPNTPAGRAAESLTDFQREVVLNVLRSEAA